MSANKRGQRVALIGLVLQTGLIGLTVALWVQTRSAPIWPGLWLIVAPWPVWLLTALLFYCRYLHGIEQEDLRQLAARGGGEGIFAGEDESHQVAAKRLQWMHRYLMPGFALALAAYHLALAALTLQWIRATETFPANNFAAIFFAAGGALASFLMSRYTTGMAEVPAWRPLRAAGSYLFANTLALLTMAVVLGLEYGGVRNVGRVVAYVFSLLLVLLGAELILNFILDLYRPRAPQAEKRLSYDSRLLDIIANPESVGRSIAEALNYQFGFEVSSSWFYRLLQRAFVPLLLAGGLIIWLMTSIVVVDEDETYVVLRFGKQHRVLKPQSTPHLIWPWPIDTARRFRTEKIHEIVLGVGGTRQEEYVRGKRVYLWSQEHGPRSELDTLVATPPRGEAPGEGPDDRPTPNVMVIKLIASVYYRITDPHKFGYQFTDAGKLLESIAHREMVRYAASATLHERLGAGAGAGRPQGLMSFGRGEAADQLKRRIIEAVHGKGLDLGVEIVAVELIGCHPPPEAASAFEEVIAAERERERLRYEAEAEASKILAQAAGSGERAWEFAQMLEFGNDLEYLLQLEQSARPKAAQEALRRANSELERLDQEIHYQRLLGRLRTAPARPGSTRQRDRRSVTEKLRDKLKAHVDRLTALHPDCQTDHIAKQLDAVNEQLVGLFSGIGGRAKVALAQARAQRWQVELAESGLASAFPAEMQIYRVAPTLYRQEKLLEVLAEALKDRKKYILAMDRNQVEVWVNLEEPVQGLRDVELGTEGQ